MNASRPNVCVLTESFSHGGTERQFTELVTRLDRQKYNVRLACLNRAGPLYEQVRAAGLPVAEFPLRGWLNGKTARSAWEWVRLLRLEKIDLVHTFDLYTDIFSAPLARFGGVPVLITSLRQMMSAYSPRQRRALRRSFQLSDCVIANSQRVGDSLVADEGLSAARVRVLYNGVDLERFHPNGSRLSARERLGWGRDGLLVGVICNLRPEKDHRTLLDAVPQVVRRAPRVHFLIVGTGSLEGHLRRYAEQKQLLSHVSFLGDRSDIPEILEAVDLAVLPTLLESMPNVVLEAMSAGRPIIASDVGGCRELIGTGRTGMLVPPRDPRILAEEIVRLLEQPSLREEMGQAARRRAEEKFDFSRAVKHLEEIYDDMLERSGRGRRDEARCA